MTDRLRNKHQRVESDLVCGRPTGPWWPPQRESTRSNCGVLVIRRVLPHSDSASGILTGMATRRKPKNPGGRPAVWGPRHTMSIRPPEGLYSKLEDAAEAAGLTVAEYCVVELAASHDFELPNTNSDQLPLAIGA